MTRRDRNTKQRCLAAKVVVRAGSSCGGNGGIGSPRRERLHLANAYLQDDYYFGQIPTIVIAGWIRCGWCFEWRGAESSAIWRPAQKLGLSKRESQAR